MGYVASSKYLNIFKHKVVTNHIDDTKNGVKDMYVAESLPKGKTLSSFSLYLEDPAYDDGICFNTNIIGVPTKFFKYSFILDGEETVRYALMEASSENQLVPAIFGGADPATVDIHVLNTPRTMISIANNTGMDDCNQYNNGE